MRLAVVMIAASLAAPAALAQPLDPVREAQDRALADQIAMQQDAANRRTQDALRDLEVARQRQETEQRLQLLGAQRTQPAVVRPSDPPVGSSGRTRIKPSQDKPSSRS
jgi:hypothetical protein